jgi:predicted Zn-dependent protease
MKRRTFLTLPKDGGPVLSEQEAHHLVDRILTASGADETSVALSGTRRVNSRYAVNRITTAGESVNLIAAITARFGRRSATLSINEFDNGSLLEAVGAVGRMARLAPDDPEWMPLLGPQEYGTSGGWHESTAGLDAERRAAVAASAIEQAEAANGDITASGFMDVRAGARALGNSAGLFAYHPATSVSYSLTARTGDGTGSGWAGVGHRDWSRVDSDAMHVTAIEKAIRSRRPRSLEPGKYPVILGPEAVADLVGLLVRALDARAADEGRSAFSAPDGTKLGERVVGERVTLRSDPIAMGGAPFRVSDGFPARLTPWIENGVLRNLAYSRFWAQEKGREPISLSSSFRMEGVENGQISHPVNNFRWNDSPLFVLRNLEGLGRPVRVTSGGSGDSMRETPPLRASEFNFSSISEAVLWSDESSFGLPPARRAGWYWCEAVSRPRTHRRPQARPRLPSTPRPAMWFSPHSMLRRRQAPTTPMRESDCTGNRGRARARTASPRCRNRVRSAWAFALWSPGAGGSLPRVI